MDKALLTSISSFISLAAILLAAGAMSPSHAQSVQKWVDEKGKVHYGDMPPPTAKTSAVKQKMSTSSSQLPKPAQPPVKQANQGPAKKAAQADPSEADRRAAADATASARARECQTRIATLHQQVRAYRADARRGTTNQASDADFDNWAAKEDAWIAANCGGQ